MLIYSVKGKQGKDLFEFLASQTKVEWGLLLGKDKDGNIAGYLSTSHKQDANIGSNYVISSYKDVRYEDNYHNHPNKSERPSGLYLDNKKGDIEAFQEIDAKTLMYINHYIYTNSKYIHIDPYEKKYNP